MLIRTSTDDNPIIKLAKETGTELHEWRQNTLIVDRDGRLVPSGKANDALATVWDILEKAIAYSKSTSDSIDASLSLYDYFVQHCNSMVQSGIITQENAELVLSMSEMWGAYVGERVEQQSLKFFFMEDCIDGSMWNIALSHNVAKTDKGSGDCFIPTNYKRIMTRVAAKPLEGADLRLNTTMASLTAVKAAEKSRRQVELRTTNGTRESFDAAIVTTPLGWLKRHREAIQPISNRISQAINSLSFGNLEKVSNALNLVLRSFTHR